MEKETVVLQLPESFATACKKYNVDPQDVMQFFISKLAYVSILIADNGLITSKATKLLEAFSGLPIEAVSGDEFYEIYLRYFLSLPLMVLNAKWSDGAYKDFMEKWYNTLSIYNNKQLQHAGNNY